MRFSAVLSPASEVGEKKGIRRLSLGADCTMNERKLNSESRSSRVLIPGSNRDSKLGKLRVRARPLGDSYQCVLTRFAEIIPPFGVVVFSWAALFSARHGVKGENVCGVWKR